MNLPFLASFIVFILLISITVKRQAKSKKAQDEAFWEREQRANSVRKKPLDNLKYIHIPLETFPTHLLNEKPEVMECIEIIESLTSQKIVNLTGYSNTDLKLEYGTANITILTEYDQNYTVLVRTLQKWADYLLEAGFDQEAATLMEFAIITGSDISRTYYLLAECYVLHGRAEQIDFLLSAAGNLHSSNKNKILGKLKESYPGSLSDN